MPSCVNRWLTISAAPSTSSEQPSQRYGRYSTPQEMLEATRRLARRESISSLLNSVASLLDDRPLADRAWPAINSVQYVRVNSAALMQVNPLSIPLGIIAQSPSELVSQSNATASNPRRGRLACPVIVQHAAAQKGPSRSMIRPRQRCRSQTERLRIPCNSS